MKTDTEPILINGSQYITVQEFAAIVNRSDQTVYNLIKKGNSIRKLKCINIAGKHLILYKEVVDFPFTWSGKCAKDNIYHYTYDGRIAEQTYKNSYNTEGIEE